MIATNAEVEQWEVLGDGQERQSQWTAVERLEIVMDISSGGWQRQCNGQWDRKAIAMGNGMVVAQWTAQRAANDCCWHRRGTMGGDTRWMGTA